MGKERDRLNKRLRVLRAAASKNEKLLKKADAKERSILEIGLKAIYQETRKIEREKEKLK